MTVEEFERLVERYKDAVVNAVLVGQSNPRLGDMMDANRVVGEDRAALIAAFGRVLYENQQLTESVNFLEQYRQTHR